jgi:anion-transporting  ArsA/GET3 family ATPase
MAKKVKEVQLIPKSIPSGPGLAKGEDIKIKGTLRTTPELESKVTELVKKRNNVLEYKPEHKIEGFKNDDDELAGKTKEELLEDLGKTGVGLEQAKGKVVTDLLTGDKLASTKIDENEEAATSLQQLEPENIKQYLTIMVKQSLIALVPEEMPEEELEKLINDFETRLIALDTEFVKKMSVDDVKQFYGDHLFDAIKKAHNTNAFKLAKKLLMDFKEGIIEYTGIVDTMDEMNKHLKFFKDSGIDELQKSLQEEIKTIEFKTNFHQYTRYLELYIAKLESDYKDANNKFIDEELRISKEKLEAVTEALSFNQIFAKVETAKSKILKDFKDTKSLYRGISDFLGKLHADSSMNITFPLPRGFNVKSNVSEALTGIWISFFEMSMLRYHFPKLETITISQYNDMINTLYGHQIQIPDSKDDENVFDVANFINEIGITKADCEEAIKAGVGITYIIARTFKPASLNDPKQKYILSYTMNIISQGMNRNYSELINDLVMGVKKRLEA